MCVRKNAYQPGIRHLCIVAYEPSVVVEEISEYKTCLCDSSQTTQVPVQAHTDKHLSCTLQLLQAASSLCELNIQSSCPWPQSRTGMLFYLKSHQGTCHLVLSHPSRKKETQRESRDGLSCTSGLPCHSCMAQCYRWQVFLWLVE